ncbi:putative lipoprotein [hydrothermal vent metagenome]|uniref:Putative lipoprotein n=1 Tax=hydrothermal vent metagenome TaxID=652676 RepID=A0A3B1CWL4_9ZZZZ
MKSYQKLTLLLIVFSLCSACANMGAKPWEHDLLAEKSMSVDPNPIQSSFDDHIYFSKEASSGGRSYGGGGCGCN